MRVGFDAIVDGQQQPKNIRNLCILAHVDHGKTTLSDHLLTVNDVVSPGLAGEMMFMDWKPEEKLRGITMKSGSMSLVYKPGMGYRNNDSILQDNEEKYLINLIDSPGHVDFCSEVSTAVRCCDGAFVVVDAVEGVQVQTRAVLRQAWEEKVEPCLIVNKIDRLCLGMGFDTEQAFHKIRNIVAEVNHVWSGFESEHFMSLTEAVTNQQENGEILNQENEEEFDAALLEESTEEKFSTQKNNIAFTSAIDGWGFTIRQFAQIFNQQLKCSVRALEKALWGNYYYHKKTQQVLTKKQANKINSKLKPMFASFILEMIWKVYAIENQEEFTQILKVIEKIAGRKIEGVNFQETSRSNFSAIKKLLRAWLPLSEATLGMAVTQLPDPVTAASTRINCWFGGQLSQIIQKINQKYPENVGTIKNLHNGLIQCDSGNNIPVVVFIAKIMAIKLEQFLKKAINPDPPNINGEVFLAFGRVFAGEIVEGQRVHVLSHLYDPLGTPNSERQTIKVGFLYIMMGGMFYRVKKIPAGNVCAIAGLDTSILKSATLSSTPCCPPLSPMTHQAVPLVQVDIQPKNLGDFEKLRRGLFLLDKADASVEVDMPVDKGENLLRAAGQVHLETCIQELQERFAQIELHVSPPIVKFKEGVYHPSDGPEDYVAPPIRVAQVVMPNHLFVMRFRVKPIHQDIIHALEQKKDLLQQILKENINNTNNNNNNMQAQNLQQQPSQNSLQNQATKNDSVGENISDSSKNNIENIKNIDSNSEIINNNQQQDQIVDHNINRLKEEINELIKQHPQFGEIISNAWLMDPEGMNFLLASESDQQQLWNVRDELVSLRDRFNRAKNIGKNSSKDEEEGREEDEDDANGVEEGSMSENLFIDKQTKTYPVFVGWKQAAAALGFASQVSQRSHIVGEVSEEWQSQIERIESGVRAGFRAAVKSGPLCEEPMWGVAIEFAIQLVVKLDPYGNLPQKLDYKEDTYGMLMGQAMSSTSRGCRAAILDGNARMVEALYLAQIQVPVEELSGVYASINERRSQILDEEQKEGTDIFMVYAKIPVEATVSKTPIEPTISQQTSRKQQSSKQQQQQQQQQHQSSDIIQDLRNNTSGAASCQLTFSHWERNVQDPLFTRLRTKEEEEEHGAGSEEYLVKTNLARRLMNDVRRRKGLYVEEKIVENATKQRTLARKV